MIPARFKRDAGSKIVGLLTYVAIVPILSFFTAAILFLPFYALAEWGKLSPEIGTAFIIVMFPLVLIALMTWAVRDYRRRAFAEVIVHNNRIELTSGRKYRLIRFDDVSSVHLVRAGVDMACILQMQSGERVRIHEEVAPFSEVCAPLEATLIDHLARRLPERLDSEQEILLRESRLKPFFFVPFGVGILFVGAALCVTIQLFRHGVTLLHAGKFWIQVGYLAACGGFTVRHDGVLPGRETCNEPIPWSQLVLWRRDACGITLKAIDGRKMSASCLARDCWPVSKLIANAYLQRQEDVQTNELG